MVNIGEAMMEEIEAILEENKTPPIPEEYDDFASLRSAVAICMSILLLVSGSILIIAINNWMNDELIGPGTQLTSRQTEYDALVEFDKIKNRGLDGTGVTVCIVDSGIDLTHPDLANLNLLEWRDFVNEQSEPYDDHGHGTSMAGLLIADGGLSGNAKGVDLLIAKALSKDGQGEDDWVSDAIDWCVQKGAEVISLSLGGAPGVLPSFISGENSGDAANDAINEGVFVVAAAGNDGEEENDEDVDSPGSEELVICVGGVQLDGQIWSGSSKGDNGINIFPPRLARDDPNKKPEIVAPAERVPVLSIVDSGYGFASGTSAATVYVTAAISVLLEKHPELKRGGADGGSSSTIENVKQWIMNSAFSSKEEHDEYYGYGLLQVDTLLIEATNSSAMMLNSPVQNTYSCAINEAEIICNQERTLIAQDRN